MGGQKQIDEATVEINLHVSVTIQGLRDDGDKQIEFNRYSIHIDVTNTIKDLEKAAADYLIKFKLTLSADIQVKVDNLNAGAALRIKLLMEELEDLWDKDSVRIRREWKLKLADFNIQI